MLVIGHDEHPDRSFVRRIDAGGQMGPVRVLSDRPIGSFGGVRPLLVTSDGSMLCIEPWTASVAADASRERQCAVASPLTIAPFDGAVALLEPLAEPSEQDSSTPDGRFAPRPAAPLDPSEPPSVRIGLRRMSPDSPAATEPADTGLTVHWPLPGMSLVDAVPTADGIAVAWYEHLRFVGRGRGRRAEAELRAGRIDKSGNYLPSSRVRLAAGPRDYGFIEGHLEPRLVAAEGRAAFVGRTVDTKGRAKQLGYEARALDAPRTSDANPLVCRIDPAALARRVAPTESEMRGLEALARRSPAIAPGQPRSEIGQIVWASSRGYYLAEGELESVDRQTGELRTEPWPFVAARERVLGAGLNRAGEALARTRTRLARLTSDGQIAEREIAGTSVDAVAHAVAGEGFPLRRAVQIGDGWWTIAPRPGTGADGWQVARIDGAEGAAGAPSRAARAVRVDPSSTALVGGAGRGLLLTVRFDHAARAWLDVYSIEPGGSQAQLASHGAPVTTELVAVERAAGGAIVVGRTASDAERLVAFAIDAQGALGPPAQLGPAAEPAAQPLELTALPTGGALLTRRGGSAVTWLDDEAQLVATRPWPAEQSAARCLDGEPARTWVPSPTPGELIRVAELARPGTCVVVGPAWAADGSLRWIGTRSLGLDVTAEVGLLHHPGGARGAPFAPAVDGGASQKVARAPEAAPTAAALPCPPDMVNVAGRFCIDRYEARLADAESAQPLAPDWPATPGLAQAVLGAWTTGRWRSGDLHAQAWPLPPLLRAVDAKPTVVARSVRGVRPSGYLTGLTAELACQNAGKRLCTADEFALACRGQEDRKFPYGADYVAGACNVFRDLHPATVLHGNAAVGHLDPRLNRVLERGAPLLRPTGRTPRCRSRWGDDYVYDLVGNLDEWLADPKGAFAGGFYSRATRAGCEALVTAHPRRYLDYSTGTRCCRDVERPAG